MCNNACVEFGRSSLEERDISGKKIIEVGSLDVNGSLRSVVEGLKPRTYLGVDIKTGPGVDEICAAEDLIKRFGKECFDLVVSTEMLEHIRDWRKVVSNLKNLLKANGVLLITTRSIGCRYHGYPFDFWRYEVDDARVIFSDLLLEVIEKDPLEPGIFVKARKPLSFIERDLRFHELYSVIKSKRCRDVSDFDISAFKLYWWLRSLSSAILPEKIRGFLSNSLV